VQPRLEAKRDQERTTHPREYRPRRSDLTFDMRSPAAARSAVLPVFDTGCRWQPVRPPSASRGWRRSRPRATPGEQPTTAFPVLASSSPKHSWTSPQASACRCCSTSHRRPAGRLGTRSARRSTLRARAASSARASHAAMSAHRLPTLRCRPRVRASPSSCPTLDRRRPTPPAIRPPSKIGPFCDRPQRPLHDTAVYAGADIDDTAQASRLCAIGVRKFGLTTPSTRFIHTSCGPFSRFSLNFAVSSGG
jgi:hypothetical protein